MHVNSFENVCGVFEVLWLKLAFSVTRLNRYITGQLLTVIQVNKGVSF